MQRLEVSGAVRPVYGSLGVKWLRYFTRSNKHYFLPFNHRFYKLLSLVSHTILLIFQCPLAQKS